MKKILVAALSLLLSSLALALPAPSEIEAAVNAGHLSQAEGMVREVIREKPASAKAHYELGQILAREGRNAEARNELLEAQRLDPALKFVSDPKHFRELLSKIPGETAKAPVRSSAGERAAAQPSAQGGASFPVLWVLIGGGVLLLAWSITRRRTVAQVPPLGAAAAGSGMAGGNTAGYAPAASPAQAPGSGAGVGSALLGGAAGLAAGYGLAKLLEDREGGSVAGAHPAHERADPVEAAKSPADFGAFDPGTGDSWDDGSSAGGDDSW